MAIDDLGRERRGPDLDGATLDLGQIGVLRIEGIERDAQARFPEHVWLIDAQLRQSTAFVPICPPDAQGDHRALMYQGYLDGELRYVDAPERFSISCLSGVEAKCLRWGYLPWRMAPDAEQSLAPYFESCIRLARADYCGNDQPTTRNGTEIDIYDRIGIQQMTPGIEDFDFEAGWAPSGAVCVHHPRIAENLDLAELARTCPRLAAATLGTECDEAMSARSGALLFNRSVDRRPALAAH